MVKGKERDTLAIPQLPRRVDIQKSMNCITLLPSQGAATSRSYHELQRSRLRASRSLILSHPTGFPKPELYPLAQKRCKPTWKKSLCLEGKAVLLALLPVPRPRMQRFKVTQSVYLTWRRKIAGAVSCIASNAQEWTTNTYQTCG